MSNNILFIIFKIQHGVRCWFIMGRRKKDQADKSGSQHDESINKPQQTTCTDAQISTNTLMMSSGLIGNVS